MKPGTYRIVNLSNGGAITEKDNDIVVSSKADSEDQQVFIMSLLNRADISNPLYFSLQWFVQYAGDGFQIKNVASGGYLAAIAEIGYEGRLQTPYCGRYLTTWMLVADPANRGRTMYGIILADAGVALNSFSKDSKVRFSWINLGSGWSCILLTQVSIFPESTTSTLAMATWIFEHISDTTGEEVIGITQAQAPAVDSRAEELIKSQEVEIAFLRRLVTDGRQEVAKLLSQVDKLQSLSRSVGSDNS
ncbi:hypothetical protein ACGC1H_005018 [Rhizoctonia solani]